ncbi:paraneoplastic antigen Ma6E-like [Panicum hallii]|uniref:paraneoplastic antigen Ma6E-like n=1 Tax=Panicum hallii TaxID=206008 RepID=UPI000DF4DBAB|nr:paraneoplastic antigen Ma6E-like [Panicum hallii]
MSTGGTGGAVGAAGAAGHDAGGAAGAWGAVHGAGDGAAGAWCAGADAGGAAGRGVAGGAGAGGSKGGAAQGLAGARGSRGGAGRGGAGRGGAGGSRGHARISSLPKSSGSVHDTTMLYNAMKLDRDFFPHPPKGKYYVVDAGYPNRPGYLAPYKGESGVLDFERVERDENYEPTIPESSWFSSLAYSVFTAARFLVRAAEKEQQEQAQTESKG